LQEDVSGRNLRRKKGDALLGCSGQTALQREQRNRFAQGVYRQRLCKHGNYAPVEESGVFRALRVAPQTFYAALR
jgi:hypothetical protein